MTPKHCSDERLLAWLDGEHNPLAAALTRRHLNSCWECRSRVARMEEAALQLAEAQRRGQFLTPERVEAARERFLRQAALRSRSQAPAIWKRVPAYGLFGSLCLAAGVGVWETWKPVEIAPVGRAVRVAKTVPATALPLPIEPRVVPRPAAPVQQSPTAERAPVPEDGWRAGDVVMVWSALHELGLCRERAVELQLVGGKLRLKGVISSTSLQERLAARLSASGVAVQLDVVSVEDIAPTERAPASSEQVARVDAPGEALLVEWLTRQGVSARDAAARSGEIANASVLAADLAWSEAWALRDLALRFGARWRELAEPERTIVLSMARDHWSELQTMAARQRRLIGGILPAAQHPGEDLFTAIERWTEAAQQLFAPAERVEAEARQLTGRIASGLAGIEALEGDDGALAELLQSGRLSVARVR